MEGQKHVQEIQLALEEAGYTPGKIDGIWGRKTIGAVQSFQKGKGLIDDGILGPATLAALFNHNKRRIAIVGAIPPWMSEAMTLINTKEFLGKRNNPAILDWAKNIDIPYSGDDTPWCGLFIGHCIASTLPKETIPRFLLRAKDWITCGISVTPRFGAIMVFWRESQESGKGHVGFYAGEDRDAYRILGGNQSDAVCYAWVSKKRFLEARWPRSADSLVSLSAIVEMNRTEDLNTAEE